MNTKIKETIDEYYDLYHTF